MKIAASLTSTSMYVGSQAGAVGIPTHATCNQSKLESTLHFMYLLESKYVF